jgi:hypothetical protein
MDAMKIGQLPSQLDIRLVALLPDFNEKAASRDEFHCLLSVCPANILHILFKRIFVEVDRRGGHQVRQSRTDQ